MKPAITLIRRSMYAYELDNSLNHHLSSINCTKYEFQKSPSYSKLSHTRELEIKVEGNRLNPMFKKIEKRKQIAHHTKSMH